MSVRMNQKWRISDSSMHIVREIYKRFHTKYHRSNKISLIEYTIRWILSSRRMWMISLRYGKRLYRIIIGRIECLVRLCIEMEKCNLYIHWRSTEKATNMAEVIYFVVFRFLSKCKFFQWEKVDCSLTVVSVTFGYSHVVNGFYCVQPAK